MRKYRRWPSKWSKAEYARVVVEAIKEYDNTNQEILESLMFFQIIGSMEPLIINRVAKHLRKGKRK